MPVTETEAGSVGALTLLSRHIRETDALIERAVGEVCGSFAETARLAQTNLDRTSSFLGQSGEENDVGHLMAGSEQVLSHLLERLGEAGEQSRTAIGRLNQIEEWIGKVSRALRHIDDITTANRILAVNVRIQVAQLGQMGSGLGVVADEISAQAKRATEFSDAIATLIGQLRETVALSRDDLTAMASQDRAALDQSRGEVVRTHQNFRDFLDRSQRLLGEAAVGGRHLTVQLHDAVRGLQFQDRAGQRLRYVAGELDRLADGGNDAAELGAMMARTSMEEQRDPAANARATEPGEVELF